MRKNTPYLVVLCVVLLVVAACSYVFGKHIGARREAERSRIAAHHAAVDHCRALGEEANRRVHVARRARMSIASFEEEFGKLEAVGGEAPAGASNRATHIYTHEPSHRVFYLRFQDGVLMGTSSSHGPDDIQPRLSSTDAPVMERVRSVAAALTGANEPGVDPAPDPTRYKCSQCGEEFLLDAFSLPLDQLGMYGPATGMVPPCPECGAQDGVMEMVRCPECKAFYVSKVKHDDRLRTLGRARGMARPHDICPECRGYDLRFEI